MVLCPWIAYLIAEGLNMSGIVAVLVNGMILSSYGAPNMSRPSREALKLGYETAAYACQTIVFLFLGIGLFAFEHPFKDAWILILVTIVVLNVSRFFNIFITSLVANLCRS